MGQFNYNSADVRLLAEDETVNMKKRNLMFFTQKSQNRMDFSESNRSSMDDGLPELAVFLQEDSDYEFVKDICVDKGVTSRANCLKENYELDHASLSCFLNTDIENSSESSEETEETEETISSSTSTESKLTIEQDCVEDVINQCDSTDKTAPEKLLLRREVSSKKAAFARSMQHTTTNVNGSSNTSPGIGSSGDGEHHLGRGSMSSPENGFVYKHSHGESFSSGALPFSGSISVSSMGSTNSSHSFAFPVLPPEWNGSPVRMAEAERKQLQRHGVWKVFLPCCKF